MFLFFFPELVTESGSANPDSTARGLSTRQRERGLYALAHHTEAETVTQGGEACRDC